MESETVVWIGHSKTQRNKARVGINDIVSRFDLATDCVLFDMLPLQVWV